MPIGDLLKNQNMDENKNDGFKQPEGILFEKIPDEFAKKLDPELDEDFHLRAKNIHTLESDLAEFNKRENMSVAKMAIAEAERKQKNQNNFPNIHETEPNQSKKKIIISSLVLLALSAIIFVILNFINTNKQEPPVVSTKLFNPIIQPDKIKEIDMDKTDWRKIKEILSSERDNAEITVSKIISFYFTKTITQKNKDSKESEAEKILIPANEFISLLETHIPDQLKRGLLEDMMYGIHSYNNTQPFLILKTENYQTAYSGMLSWEEYMYMDFNDFFITTEKKFLPNDGIPSTLQKFEDLVVKNKDVRVLRDTQNKIFLMYSILDKNIIVITTDENTFGEIISRFSNTRLIR